MNEIAKNISAKTQRINFFFLIAILIALIVSIIFIIKLKLENDSLNINIVEIQKKSISDTDEILALKETIKVYEDTLTEAQKENLGLNEVLEKREKIIDQLDDEVDELEKLTSIDPELLNKYSKVFFLNEHYSPDELIDIQTKYIFNVNKPQKFHTDIIDNLEEMIDDARKDDVGLYVLSAHRSFEDQQTLKSNYTVLYGSGANQFSADQGYSEHQLGTTVDFTNLTIGSYLNGFENSKEYKWLLDNAYKYGFIISYPSNNSYYIFEPWHWRYVGLDLAKDLYEDGKYFYDLDQREIDEYLIKFFDEN